MLRLLVLLLPLALQSRAELVQGSVDVPARQIVFLHKFCFDYDPERTIVGEWSAAFHSHGGGNLELVLFDDEAESLPDSGHIDWSLQCGSERLKRAAHGLMKLDGEELRAAGGLQVTRKIVEKVRPRWWYLAVVDCSGQGRVLDYSVHLANVKQGWQSELSMDQCGPAAVGLLCLAYFAVLLAQAVASSQGGAASLMHPLRVCLSWAIAAAACGALLQLANTAHLAQHGVGMRPVYVAGKLSKWTSKLLLTAAIMLMSKGYAVSRPFHTEHLARACCLLAPLFVGCFALDIGGEYAQSRRYTTDSMFCSRYGAVLVLLDIGLLAAFARGLQRSHSAEADPVKRGFYAAWGPVYAAAFCILPVATLVAYLVSPWVQVRVVYFLTNAVHASLLALLVISVWPERSLPALCLDNPELVQTYGVKDDLLPSLLQKKGPSYRVFKPQPEAKGVGQIQMEV